jgi:hypothetical protein
LLGCDDNCGQCDHFSPSMVLQETTFQHLTNTSVYQLLVHFEQVSLTLLLPPPIDNLPV